MEEIDKKVFSTPSLLVSGPTASGKSELAVKIAEYIGGEIINIDSVQVYKEFDIGSAKPTKELLERVTHYGIDFLNPDELSTAEKMREIVFTSINKILNKKKIPILVGSSGMYISALFHRFSPLPERDEKIREELEKESTEELYAKLSSLDPKRGSELHPNDRVRIIRAIEVMILSKERVSDSFKQEMPILNALMLVLAPKREVLYERINSRSMNIIKSGLIEETRNIIKKYGKNIPPLKSLGYAEAVKFLDGDISEEKLIESVSLGTRRYSKRQITFWNNEPQKRSWNVYPQNGYSFTFRDDDIKNGKRILVSEIELFEKLKNRLQEKLQASEVWFLDP